MKINEIKNEALGESVFCFKHPTGLEIMVMPRPDYDAAYAVFATKYGSIDTNIKNADGSFETIPEGTAHFLEHKLFESEDLDAFERFAKTGANANAYTSFDKTAYLFSCSENFDESLEILLDFVQKPYFTQETVEKEQGIIGQEIRMYQDMPDWQVMFNLLRALYCTHPVRIDIGGTQDSIAKISAELLHSLYNDFYNLNNMVLVVCGNATVEQVRAAADKCLVKAQGKPIERKFVPESPEPLEKFTEEKLSVASSQFLLGYKEPLQQPELTLEQEFASQIMLEALAGKSSPMFKELVESDLADMGFSTELFNGFGYSCVMIGGVSADTEKAVDVIKRAIAEAQKDGISPEAFERAKKKLYGRMIMGYNDIDNIANLIMGLYFTGNKPFAELDACKGVTLDDVNARLNLLKDEYSALSVVSPIS